MQYWPIESNKRNLLARFKNYFTHRSHLYLFISSILFVNDQTVDFSYFLCLFEEINRDND